MCGIAGICCINSSDRFDADTICSMLSSIRHRGPDESGIYLDNHAALGHCRLSIIDLAGGIQPLSNENEDLWITYNGEIFNFPELKRCLDKHNFKTRTDTEVLLHLFEDHGIECLDMLNGQFAFAIWNSSKKELFLARDRLGIRPLFYTIQDNKIIFASEIKAVFQYPRIDRELDCIALDQIFTFWTTLPGYTAFKGIRELPPGHYLHLKNGIITIKQYWQTPLCREDSSEYSDLKEASEKLSCLITDSINIRLRADVPVGSYLSGGLDSSGITAKIVNKFNNRLTTFGIRFDDPDFDETAYQKHMVNHLKTNHTELLASNNLIADNFDRVIYHSEKPMTRTAPAPLFLLSKVVRDSNYKVVLTGEGADEFFGGYNIFREAKIRYFCARQPEATWRTELFGRIYPYIFNNPRMKKSLQAFFTRGMLDFENPYYSHCLRWANTCRIKSFWDKPFQKSVGQYDAIGELDSFLPGGFGKWDILSRAQFLESSLFMSNYLLSSQGDRVAMAHSLEIRLPFLDYRLLEALAALPRRWKISGIKEKFILRKIFENDLPADILNRTKQPYRAPVINALTADSSSYSSNMVSEDMVKKSGIFDYNKVSLLLKKIKNNRQPSEIDNMALCLIVSTQMLIDQFICNPVKIPEPYQVDMVIDKRNKN